MFLMSQIFFFFCNCMLRISCQGRDHQTLCTYAKKTIVTLVNQLHLEAKTGTKNPVNKKKCLFRIWNTNTKQEITLSFLTSVSQFHLMFFI